MNNPENSDTKHNKLFYGSMWETAYFSCGVDKIEILRPNIYQAIKRVLKAIEDQGGSFSLDEVGAIIAPKPEWRGCNYPIKPPCKVVLYFSPSLETSPKAEIEFVIAHEFAHIALKHNLLNEGEADSVQLDIQADSLAQKWGFQKPDWHNPKMEGGQKE